MQPYNKQFTGTQRQWTLYKVSGLSTEIYGQVPSGSRTLSCPTTVVRGNFKDANPWSYSRSITSSLYGTEIVNDTVSLQYNSGYIGSTFVKHPDVSEAISRALTIADARMNEKVRGSLDLAVSIAEAGQTVKMLNLVKRYSDSVVHIRRTFLSKVWDEHFSRKRARRLQRNLRNWQRDVKVSLGTAYKPLRVTRGLVSKVSTAGANGWLEFTYGLMPLVQDIKGVATNIVGSVRNYLTRFKVKSKQVIRERSKTSGPSGHLGTNDIVGVACVTYGIQMKPGFDSSLAIWTSLNPFSIVYELTPLSFVFDWILDIGGYMRNLETSLLYKGQFVQGYRSILWTYTSKTVFASYVKPSATSSRSLSAVCSYQVTSFFRTILTNYPLPQPPKLHPDLGSSRLLSAAALLRQRLKL